MLYISISFILVRSISLSKQRKNPILKERKTPMHGQTVTDNYHRLNTIVFKCVQIVENQDRGLKDHLFSIIACSVEFSMSTSRWWVCRRRESMNECFFEDFVAIFFSFTSVYNRIWQMCKIFPLKKRQFVTPQRSISASLTKKSMLWMKYLE